MIWHRKRIGKQLLMERRVPRVGETKPLSSSRSSSRSLSFSRRRPDRDKDNRFVLSPTRDTRHTPRDTLRIIFLFFAQSRRDKSLRLGRDLRPAEGARVRGQSRPRRTSNIEHRTENIEGKKRISDSPFRCSMLTVRCSMFKSRQFIVQLPSVRA